MFLVDGLTNINRTLNSEQSPLPISWNKKYNKKYASNRLVLLILDYHIIPIIDIHGKKYKFTLTFMTVGGIGKKNTSCSETEELMANSNLLNPHN